MPRIVQVILIFSICLCNQYLQVEPAELEVPRERVLPPELASNYQIENQQGLKLAATLSPPLVGMAVYPNTEDLTTSSKGSETPAFDRVQAQHDLNISSNPEFNPETASNALPTVGLASPATMSAFAASAAKTMNDALGSAIDLIASATRILETATASLRDAASGVDNMTAVPVQPFAQEDGSQSSLTYQIPHDAVSQVHSRLEHLEAVLVVMGFAEGDLQNAFEATQYAVQQLVDKLQIGAPSEQTHLEAAAVNANASNAQSAVSLSESTIMPASNSTSHHRQELGQPHSSTASSAGSNQSNSIPENRPDYSLLPDGTLQLPDGEILTRDFVVVQADGSREPASGWLMQEVADSSPVGFELPPFHDSIYHPAVNRSRMEDLECDICFDKMNPEDFSNMNCDCFYCNKCLNEALRHAFTTRSLYPPRCGCGEEIDLSYLEPVLDEDTSMLRSAVAEEWKTENPTYCGNSSCSTFIPAVRFGSDHDSTAQFGICPACEEKTCSKCKRIQPAHEGLCGKCPLEIVPKELYALIKKEKLTRCPRCKVLVGLEDGCNHVWCTCGTEFCFDCGLPVHNCECSQVTASQRWRTSASGLMAEIEVNNWPAHRKVIVPDTTEAGEENFFPCEHLRAIAAAGKARCHGCLQIFDSLKRCYDCRIELCIFCRPQRPNYDREL